MKIARSGIGDNYLERSLNQTNIFARRIVFQTFSLQIKQNLYLIGTYSAPEAIQILVRMYRKIYNNKTNSSSRFGLQPLSKEQKFTLFLHLSRLP